MFTIQQIKDAHSKVKTGADYPVYVQELLGLGVTGYSTFLQDGHTVYYGADDYTAAAPGWGVERVIAPLADIALFSQRLLLHQQGGTNFPAFCDDAAACGVEKWLLNFTAMTCTYFDKAGNIILEEKLGQA